MTDVRRLQKSVAFFSLHLGAGGMEMDNTCVLRDHFRMGNTSFVNLNIIH